jgi:hypothetical protein
MTRRLETMTKMTKLGRLVARKMTDAEWLACVVRRARAAGVLPPERHPDESDYEYACDILVAIQDMEGD